MRNNLPYFLLSVTVYIVSMATYTHKQKVKLVDKIQNLKRKKDLVKVYEIIQEDDINVTENSNGVFMYFHALKPETYIKIEEYIKKANRRKRKTESEEFPVEYVPYAQEEFPSQKEFGPKLKYSTGERNLIKRKRYEQNINSDKESDVIYCGFNVSMNTTDSDS